MVFLQKRRRRRCEYATLSSLYGDHRHKGYKRSSSLHRSHAILDLGGYLRCQQRSNMGIDVCAWTFPTGNRLQYREEERPRATMVRILNSITNTQDPEMPLDHPIAIILSLHMNTLAFLSQNKVHAHILHSFTR